MAYFIGLSKNLNIYKTVCGVKSTYSIQRKREYNMSCKEMHKRINEVLEKWNITKEEKEKNNKIIDSIYGVEQRGRIDDRE